MLMAASGWRQALMKMTLTTAMTLKMTPDDSDDNSHAADDDDDDDRDDDCMKKLVLHTL